MNQRDVSKLLMPNLSFVLASAPNWALVFVSVKRSYGL